MLFGIVIKTHCSMDVHSTERCTMSIWRFCVACHSRKWPGQGHFRTLQSLRQQILLLHQFSHMLHLKAKKSLFLQFCIICYILSSVNNMFGFLCCMIQMLMFFTKLWFGVWIKLSKWIKYEHFGCIIPAHLPMICLPMGFPMKTFLFAWYCQPQTN